MSARADRTINGFWRQLRRSTSDAADRVAVDGLVAFSPVWAAAAIFSLAGDRNMLMFRDGALLGSITWFAVGVAMLLIWRPRWTQLLGLLAAIMFTRYMIAMPVAGNNKMITAFMNAGILIIGVHALLNYKTTADIRENMYEHMRVVARALLAVMYFYGIFHKINTDFLDPRVSCAVALYMPLADGFGLQDSLTGKYLAIWSTFIVEAIAIVALYWKRYFAVGLLLALMFHFVIPISVYSWYMDFSSLVLALYILSVPREVSAQFYDRCASLFRLLRDRFGSLGQALPFGIVIGGAIALVALLARFSPQPTIAASHAYQSIWVLMWVVYGGLTMLLLANAALSHLPWRGQQGPLRPLWLYAVPATLFIVSAGPYMGLRTEASIAMFSNLHTEGGVTNHLVITQPWDFFPYQRDVAMIKASSDPDLQNYADRNLGLVMFTLNEKLLKRPNDWVTYELNGVRHERATAASIGAATHANALERKFLIFKYVDYARPKVCTH
ncbi:MAG: thiol-disulfide oxidoreductase [Steroidobacter sp.]